MVASSVVLTVVVLNYHHRTADIHEMPPWVKLKNSIKWRKKKIIWLFFFLWFFISSFIDFNIHYYYIFVPMVTSWWLYVYNHAFWSKFNTNSIANWIYQSKKNIYYCILFINTHFFHIFFSLSHFFYFVYSWV